MFPEEIRKKLFKRNYSSFTNKRMTYLSPGNLAQYLLIRLI